MKYVISKVVNRLIASLIFIDLSHLLPFNTKNMVIPGLLIRKLRSITKKVCGAFQSYITNFKFITKLRFNPELAVIDNRGLLHDHVNKNANAHESLCIVIDKSIFSNLSYNRRF